MVKEIDKDGVTIETQNGTDQLNARTVIWAGGVTACTLGRTLAQRTQAETDRGGRLKVNPDLTLANYPNLYVVGDLALALGPKGKPLPGVA
jgi:NADH dehydrogenase